jgi:hypothetical protein
MSSSDNPSGAPDSPLAENDFRYSNLSCGLDNSPLPGAPALACMTRSVSLSNFGDFEKVIENCGALAFPSPSPSEQNKLYLRENHYHHCILFEGF